MRPVAPSLVVFAVALGAAACGPSFQAVYEGDVRFEHCYALDEGSTAPAPAKKDCWRDWLHNYTYGQSSDRVEYAATRYGELSLDRSLPTVEGPRSASAGDPPRRPLHAVAAPVPTSAFAPPPSTMSSADPRETSPHPTEAFRTPAAPSAPGSECADGCAMAWRTCRDVCSDKACDACDKAYRLCVPACFQAAAPAGSSPSRARPR